MEWINISEQDLERLMFPLVDIAENLLTQAS